MSTTKIGENTTNILPVAFEKKVKLWHRKLKIYIWKTKCATNKQNVFGSVFSRNANKTHANQSIQQLSKFSYPSGKKRLAKFQMYSCCTFSPVNVYVVRATCFDECFLFYVTLFLKRFIATMRFFFNHHVTTFLKRNVLKEVRILHYLHSNSTILIRKSRKSCYMYIIYFFSF